MAFPERQHLLSDPFGRTTRAPRGINRTGRIAMLGEVADALMNGRLPNSVEARMYVASALLSYLTTGGDLARDHLRVSAPRGSHAIPKRVYVSSSPMNDGE